MALYVVPALALLVLAVARWAKLREQRRRARLCPQCRNGAMEDAGSVLVCPTCGWNTLRSGRHG